MHEINLDRHCNLFLVNGLSDFVYGSSPPFFSIFLWNQHISVGCCFSCACEFTVGTNENFEVEQFWHISSYFGPFLCYKWHTYYSICYWNKVCHSIWFNNRTSLSHVSCVIMVQHYNCPTELVTVTMCYRTIHKYKCNTEKHW